MQPRCLPLCNSVYRSQGIWWFPELQDPSCCGQSSGGSHNQLTWIKNREKRKASQKKRHLKQYNGYIRRHWTTSFVRVLSKLCKAVLSLISVYFEKKKKTKNLTCVNMDLLAHRNTPYVHKKTKTKASPHTLLPSCLMFHKDKAHVKFMQTGNRGHCAPRQR